jgi:transposase
MRHSTLLPDVAELSLEYLKSDRQSVTAVVRTSCVQAACPQCHSFSIRIHSHYDRKLADLPWNGIPVHIRLHTRRFFCDAADCGQRIFTERLPNTVASYGRRTRRLSDAFDWFTLALGGEAGARLARRVGILTSGETLLRQLRHRTFERPTTPRVLGIDDWAWRKGRRYGTILCDLERHAVIDLLPDRTAESVAAWLRTHPGIEIISRDRGSAYAEAARKAAPAAVQVADRWHLLRNLSDALQGFLESKHALLAQGAKAVSAPLQPPAEILSSAVPVPSAPIPTPLSHAEQLSQTKRGRRLARYKAVMGLLTEGVSQSDIARRLGVGRRTVRRWMRVGSFPERARVKRRSALDRFVGYVEQRYQDGCHNAAQLWRELREKGFRGNHGTVRKWVHHLRPKPTRVRAGPLQTGRSTVTGSPRQTAWMLLQQPPEALPYLEEISRRCPEIAAAAAVAREFARMLCEQDARPWPAWLRSAKTTALARFATSLQRDEAAVLAAMRLPWSNGQVEGQVHRLKLIKRQMYGRANFDLLRLRVVNVA